MANETIKDAQLREDGKTDTYWGTQSDHGHAVTTEQGEIEYLRDNDPDHTVYVDSSKGINDLPPQ